MCMVVAEKGQVHICSMANYREETSCMEAGYISVFLSY